MFSSNLAYCLVAAVLAQTTIASPLARTACTLPVTGIMGTCEDVSTCGGMSTPGAGCPGGVEIQCCTDSFAGDNGPSTGDVSQLGLDLVKQFEGWSATFYNDVAGVKTIGWGHACRSATACSGIVEPITQAQGNDLLHNDVQSFVRCINTNVLVALTQNQFDALQSFTYNEGCGSLQNIAQNLNVNDFGGATERMKLYNKVKDPAHGGVLVVSKTLVKRRQWEVNLFNSFP